MSIIVPLWGMLVVCGSIRWMGHIDCIRHRGHIVKAWLLLLPTLLTFALGLSMFLLYALESLQ